MSSFWSIWIIFFVLATVLLSLWLLFANRKREIKPGEDNKTGHVWDGIEEYDNPLPQWWFNMFIISIVFGVVYLIIFPGFGSFSGVKNWTQANQWQADVTRADEKYAKVYAQYTQTPIDQLANDTQAMKMGQRLFANNCAQCHGSDARGSVGFPNLTDNDWLYGGTPEAILASITNGRHAMMPAWEKILPAGSIHPVTEYVVSLSGRDHDAAQAAAGAPVFQQFCAACHGVEGKGNQAMGAPNLTDETWLYGGSPVMIERSIREGRNGNMPAQGEQMKEDKVHLLAAYVYSLSHGKQ